MYALYSKTSTKEHLGNIQPNDVLILYACIGHGYPRVHGQSLLLTEYLLTMLYYVFKDHIVPAATQNHKIHLAVAAKC